MAMVYASHASATPSGGTTITINKPTGVVEGDVLIAMLGVAGDGNNPIINSTPGGWPLVGFGQAGASSQRRAGVWYKIAGASEPSSYQWSTNQAINNAVGVIARYTPQLPSAPPGRVDAAAMGDNANPAVAPSVNAVTDAPTLISLFSSTSPGDSVSGMTERVAIPGTLTGVWIYDELLSGSGATGTRTWLNQGSSGRGWNVAISAENVVEATNRIRMMI